ncbi:MAG: hypothetical protein R3A52_10070 [Polyangiales bacterium]
MRRAVLAALALSLAACGSETVRPSVVPPGGDDAAVDAVDVIEVPDVSDAPDVVDASDVVDAVDVVDVVGEDLPPADPCGGIPLEGRCVGTTRVEACDLDEGAGAVIVRTDCGSGERCVEADAGAACVLTGECREGAASCGESGALRRCVGARWVEEPCATGCAVAAGVALCRPEVATTEVSLRVVYEARSPAPGYRGWSNTVTARPARGFRVYSFAGDDLVDVGETSVDEGAVTLRVAGAEVDGARVVVAAVTQASDGTLPFQVADPGLAAGDQPTTATPREPRSWSWSFPRAMVTDGGVLRVTESAGAGAAAVFDGVGVVRRRAAARYGSAGQSLVAWVGTDVTWDCGSCVTARAVTVNGQRYANQMFYRNDRDLNANAAPVVFHESGHWLMNSYGRSPGEGGSHSGSCASYPGLAWSEGFATWVGQETDGQPVYYSSSGGSMFWINIAARSMSSGRLPRPTLTGADVIASTEPGLLQRMSETEVSAVLWSLSNGTGDVEPLYRAVASPRMVTPTVVDGVAAFERGYWSHAWRGVSLRSCAYTGVTTTTRPSSVLPDFLDALLCAGFPAERVDRATVPTVYYPFPSSRPLCRR